MLRMSRVLKLNIRFKADLDSPCHLLNLPKELREIIWSLVLLEGPKRYDPRRFQDTIWLDALPDGEPTMYFPNDIGYAKHNALKLAEEIEPRNLSLLRVNKQIHRESGRIFWRKGEFRFKDWNTFARLWMAKGEKDIQILIQPKRSYIRGVKQFQSPFSLFQLDLARFRRDLSWSPARFNKVRSIRHIYLLGNDWGDAFIDRSSQFQWLKLKRSNLTKYYSDTLPSMLLMFPNLRQLDLGAGMVSTFSDYATPLGQRWQPVLKILRWNNRVLKAVLSDSLSDPQCNWDSYEVRAEASITIPAKGKMLLRETVWTLQ